MYNIVKFLLEILINIILINNQNTNKNKWPIDHFKVIFFCHWVSPIPLNSYRSITFIEIKYKYILKLDYMSRTNNINRNEI